MKDEPRIVIQKMQDIFRTNQLNRKEIVALLHSGDLDYGINGLIMLLARFRNCCSKNG